MSLQKVPKAARAAAGALALVMVVLFVAGCGSSSSSGDEVSFGGEGYQGIDRAGTRHAKQSGIDSSSVKGLEEAWTVPSSARPFSMLLFVSAVFSIRSAVSLV